jgi:poly-gamma-glutamate synthesis protein (capsule biosynthesis protein)
MYRSAARLLVATLLLGAVLWPLAASPVDTLTLTFVGDLMAHNVNYRMADYGRIYRAVETSLLSDDLTFANLEAVVDPSRPMSSYPQFNVHAHYVAAAIEAGVDVFSLANNHSYDWEAEGLQATLSSMRALSVAAAERGRSIWFGGISETAAEPLLPVEIRRGGWRIGYLALTEFSNTAADPQLLNLVDHHDPQEKEMLLARLREMTPRYDLFVLSYHGGVEYAKDASPAKKAFFRELLEAGVDIVHGHHPHVIQPCEEVEHEGHTKLILYSTGNFISGQSWRARPEDPNDLWARTGDSMMFRVRVRYGNPGPSVYSVSMEPAYHYRDANNDVLIAPLHALASESPLVGWQGFFRRRLELAQDYMRANPQRPPRNVVR